MNKIIIDTSVFIDYQRTGNGTYLSLLDLSRREKAALHTSAIVILEFWAGKSMDQKKVQELAKDLFYGIEIVDVNEKIAQKAGKMMREKEIEDGFDAVIAASSLEIGAEVATLNVKHFENVKGLQICKLEEKVL